MISQPFTFGYFPRNKYKDLVFYVKTGEHSNMGLFEMPDTEENRALMNALTSHNPQAEREKVLKWLQDHWQFFEIEDSDDSQRAQIEGYDMLVEWLELRQSKDGEP